MAIQITQDPINQFMDNLPSYALDLRRQDQQAKQFEADLAQRKADLEFRESTQKDNLELRQSEFDLRSTKQTKDLALRDILEAERVGDRVINQTRTEIVSDIYKNKYTAQQINRENKANLSEFKKDNAEIYDDWEEYEATTQNYTDSDWMFPIAGFRAKTFEEYLGKKDQELSVETPFNYFEEDRSKFGNLRDEYVNLNEKAITVERPKIVDFNDYPNVPVDESLWSYLLENQSESMKNNEVLDKVLYMMGYPGSNSPSFSTQRSR